MTPYAEQVVANADRILFGKVKRTLEAMPDINLPDTSFVSCHMVARALAVFFPLRFRDGYFMRKGWEHSWLTTERGNIIDAYPVAVVGGPFLLDMSTTLSPWRNAYIPAKLEVVYRDSFNKNTREVTKVMRSIVKKLDNI